MYTRAREREGSRGGKRRRDKEGQRGKGNGVARRRKEKDRGRRLCVGDDPLLIL